MVINPTGAPTFRIVKTAVEPTGVVPSKAVSTASVAPVPTSTLSTAATAVSATGDFAALPTPTEPENLAFLYDCARTPGLVSCDPGAIPISGSLAFYDASAQRLIGLDLSSGAGWQASLRGPAGWLDWASDGSALLAALGSDRYALYRRDGSLAETFSQPGSAPAPSWQGSVLVKNGIVRAEGGSRAMAMLARKNGAWELHYSTGPQGENIIALDSSQPDQYYILLAWVPGARWLLFHSFAAGGAAAQQGAALMAVNVDTGELRTIEAFTPLERDAFAFNPKRGALLAAMVSNGEPAGPAAFHRLALYDFETKEKRFPLPEEAAVTGIAWRPDGERLAVAVPALPEDASAGALAQFPTGGISLLDPQTGLVEPVTTAPAAAEDGWPQWSPDGTLLIYARAISLPSGGTVLQVRERSMRDGAEWVLVEGIPAPGSAAGRIPWGRVLSFGRR